MEVNIYQEKAKRTVALLGSPIMDDLHMILGMQTEVAEMADVYKKHIAYGKELDLVNIKEEIGDLLWYVANLCNFNNWKIEDIMDTNIAKLQARYPNKFTQEDALNRNLDVERNILEQNN